jgi:hypothetical protein
MEVLNGGLKSERDGSSSLHVQTDLQDIKKFLTDIRGQVDLGLKRVEMALHLLEQRERMGRDDKAGELGFRERNLWDRQRMDHKNYAGAVGCFKSKKKRNKKKNKNQIGLLGPKPSKASVKEIQVLGSTKTIPNQAGETSVVGTV